MILFLNIYEKISMKTFFNILIIFFFIINGVLLIMFSIKCFIIYNRFKKYLITIGDEYSVQKIEKLNPFGIRTSIFPFPEIRKTLLDKYEQTGDDNYLSFNRNYSLCIKQMVILACLLFIMFSIYQIVLA